MESPKNIRITKIFSFEAAHALTGYDGECKNIHGHSYKLHVTIYGKPINDPGNPKQGMVMDFSQLKEIINKLIINPFDHALLVKENNSLVNTHEPCKHINNITPLPYQPTCENMVADFAKKIKSKLPGEVTLHSLKLYETATSFAEWYASDNPGLQGSGSSRLGMRK